MSAFASGPLNLEQAARRMGAYQWAEMRLFEVLGAWIPSTPDHAVKVLLGEQCYHHAWHGELWQQRLPELREININQLICPANDQVVACFDAIAAPTSTIERLVGIFRVLIPRLVADYSRHLELTSEVADGPTIRALNLVLTDELADWRAGELLLQTLLRTPADVATATKHQSAIETMLVAAGGIAGDRLVTD